MHSIYSLLNLFYILVFRGDGGLKKVPICRYLYTNVENRKRFKLQKQKKTRFIEQSTCNYVNNNKNR